MTDKYSAKSDLYKEFVLCIKYRGDYYNLHKNFYNLLMNEGWVQQTELRDIRDDILDMGGSTTGSYGTILIKPNGETLAVLAHESGPEIWIIPITTFVAGAIASGIIGNAAYDLIQKLFSMLIKAQGKSSSDDITDSDSTRYDNLKYKISIILRTTDYETIDLTELTGSRQLELIQRTINNRLSQLNIEQGKMSETKSFVKRIGELESQLKESHLNYLQLANEFQKERIEWRSRIENLHLRITRLERPGK